MGFFGKLPARGDFVRSGLPRDFVAPWDAWLRRVLSASQAILGDEWEPAWLEAPVWRFALPSGQCSPNAVQGVFMPSVDRAGRYFPLTLARPGDGRLGIGFLSAAEAVGRAAIAEDWAPGKLAEALRSCTETHDFGSKLYIGEQSFWWTEGRPPPLGLDAPIIRYAGRPDIHPDAGRARRGGRAMSVERFRASAITDPGGRAQNEDAYLSRPDLGLWAVADGAGGHAGGAVASRAVVTTLETIPPGLTAAEMLAQVRLRLGSVHASLLAEAAENAKIMASTVVVLIARGEHFACLWAGDSRAYRLRDDMLDQLTSDHSLVQSLVEDGAITEAEAQGHPEANVITRAVGDGSDELGLDKVAGDILAGDRFLLCSDGLHKALPAAELARLLADDAAAAPLVAAALARGTSDNVTAVVVEVGEEAGTGAQ